MNAQARYLLVFLLGWSGAVYTYSDLIYTKTNAPSNATPDKQKVLERETGKPLIQTEEVSSSKELKLPSKASELIQKSKAGEQPKL